MQVYLDNAATTPMDESVVEAMLPFLYEHYGNPSSIHSHGRHVRSAIEKARKKVAEILNAAPSEIFFMSGGTEADNTAIRGAVAAYETDTIITSPLEHDAVINVVKTLENEEKVNVKWLSVDEKGNLDLDELNELLKDHPQSLVSLMHGNNEIGNLNDIHTAGEIVKQHHARFHSDTVQTIGQTQFDLQSMYVNYIVGSAHKFHGPKGTGFLYVDSNHVIPSLIKGGGQERQMRAGTENVAGIVGLAKALELSHESINEKNTHIRNLKSTFIEKLSEAIPGISVSGNACHFDQSMNHVININFPESPVNEMLLFNLDISQISVSGGSACSSGAATPSHVLSAMGVDQEKANVRFSFSKYNTLEEIDYVVDQLKTMYQENET